MKTSYIAVIRKDGKIRINNKVKQMDYKTNVWHPLIKDSYRWAWHDKKIVGIFQEFRRDLRRCHARIWKGYCDYDLFSINDWFLRIMPTMLEEFRDTLNGHPDFSESTSHRVIVDECEESSEELKTWKEILSKIVFLLREATEETCSKNNPYETEYQTAFIDFEKNYGSFGEKLLTEEEKEEKQHTGCKRLYFLNDVEEYKAISDLYNEEEAKLRKYRKECKDEALALFSRWFDDLWD